MQVKRVLSAVAIAAIAACGGLKNGGGTAPDEADAAPVDAAVDSGRGPGPHGSLPTGFCCTEDAECRFRHCNTVGTQKMCIEECDNPDFCSRPDLQGFTCASGADGMMCQPPAGFTCLPQDSYVRGTLPVGACCNAGYEGTNDGTAGSACEGNNCTSTGDGPLICTIICEFESDCPGGFICNPGGNLKFCDRPNPSYTCE